MKQINLLRKTLKPILGWHGARLSFLALFLIALLRVKTINLTEVATGFRNIVSFLSVYNFCPVLSAPINIRLSSQDLRQLQPKALSLGRQPRPSSLKLRLRSGLCDSMSVGKDSP